MEPPSPLQAIGVNPFPSSFKMKIEEWQYFSIVLLQIAGSKRILFIKWFYLSIDAGKGWLKKLMDMEAGSIWCSPVAAYFFGYNLQEWSSLFWNH